MFLRELFESRLTVGVCFGRWNPPHGGHVAAWKAASQYDKWFVGTNENTQDSKNPLPYAVKTVCMENLLDGVATHIVPSSTIFELITRIFNSYGEIAEIYICTDEECMYNAVKKYNGVKGSHGFYKFREIVWDKTPRLANATSMRNAVVNNNEDEFYSAAGLPKGFEIQFNTVSVPYFDIVKKYMNTDIINEKKGKLAKSARSSINGAKTWHKDGMATPYHQLRFGVALAGSPASDMPLDGPIGQNLTTVAYTQADADMVNSVAKKYGFKSTEVTPVGSDEQSTTHISSPVAKYKKNRYGV